MNVYALNTIAVGEDLIELLRSEIPIKGIIGLSDRDKTDAISDFSYQQHFCQKIGAEFIPVESYSLDNIIDKQAICAHDIDILLICGWQRLIPEWLIEHCKIAVIGSHGSPLGITKGRGRSPQNWALILGMTSFHLSIFKVDKGIDSGKVIATKTFKYSEFDDIKTSYYKASLLNASRIIDYVKDPHFRMQSLHEQDEDSAEYFPQRKPQDGQLDWTRSNREIRDFVRALTKPYPGAYSTIEGMTVKIWSAIPFDIPLSNNSECGEILKVFNKKDLLVKTSESYLLIDDYSIVAPHAEIREGMVFDSVSFREQLKTISERHKEKNKGLTLSPTIEKLIS